MLGLKQCNVIYSNKYQIKNDDDDDDANDDDDDDDDAIDVLRGLCEV